MLFVPAEARRHADQGETRRIARGQLADRVVVTQIEQPVGGGRERANIAFDQRVNGGSGHRLDTEPAETVYG